MNAIDIGVLVVLGLCVLWGLYRGFVHSLLNLGGGLVSFAASFLLFPKLADALSTNEDLIRFIGNYTDSGSLLGSKDLSAQAVSNLSSSLLSEVLEKASLPSPIDTILKTNLQNQVFSPMGDLVTTVGEYVNQTLISVSTNVICFLLCFLGCYLVFTILSNLVKSIFTLPILRHADSLAGGIVGLLMGLLLCLAFFTVLPLLESVIPLDAFRELTEQSVLGKLFSDSSLILSIMNRKL